MDFCKPLRPQFQHKTGRATVPGVPARVDRPRQAVRTGMKLFLRFFGFLFAAGTILFVVGVAAPRPACSGISPRTCPTTRSCRIMSRR